ncbi:DUF6151 family protein [Sulfitobacter sp. S190]|uniref:DUF6151 family protein n=1 Tax=Sulfitobacter sp. S190 TaxID=2867022 RepID=UPI0021A8311D|nr:DUF6151 family protein [Sulfitobacter sp. S190]UWR21457.1 hypothetical protein K3756_12180 [Sulfitobacter sp. S190]
MTDVSFSCVCGKICGTVLQAGPARGTHAQCHCKSCRRGEIQKAPDAEAPDLIGIYQTSPHLLRIETGKDLLGAFSYGPRNLLRWYATCCGSAMFNSPRNPKMAFVGIRTDRLADTDAIGPVTGRAFVPTKGGKTRHEGLRTLVVNAVTRILGNRFSGRWKETPLFDLPDATPVASVEVIAPADRARVTA